MCGSNTEVRSGGSNIAREAWYFEGTESRVSQAHRHMSQTVTLNE